MNYLQLHNTNQVNDRISLILSTICSLVWKISQQRRQKCSQHCLHNITWACEPGQFVLFHVTIVFAQRCSWQFAFPFFSSAGTVGMWTIVLSEHIFSQPAIGQSAFMSNCGAGGMIALPDDANCWGDFLQGHYILGLIDARPTFSLKSWWLYGTGTDFNLQYWCIIVYTFTNVTLNLK